MNPWRPCWSQRNIAVGLKCNKDGSICELCKTVLQITWIETPFWHIIYPLLDQTKQNFQICLIHLLSLIRYASLCCLGTDLVDIIKVREKINMVVIICLSHHLTVFPRLQHGSLFNPRQITRKQYDKAKDENFYENGLLFLAANWRMVQTSEAFTWSTAWTMKIWFHPVLRKKIDWNCSMNIFKCEQTIFWFVVPFD